MTFTTLMSSLLFFGLISTARQRVIFVVPRTRVQEMAYSQNHLFIDVCSLPKDPGSCLSAIPRYYFNPYTHKCQIFTFGGCGGNQNNFKTADSCFRTCACAQPAKQGSCRGGYVPRYHFNAVKNTCELFVWSGCEKNGNNFDSEIECMSKCSPCYLPPDRGLCGGNYIRYYFEPGVGCRPFTYGGCGGNANNFETGTACVQRCFPKSAPTSLRQPRVSANVFKTTTVLGHRLTNNSSQPESRDNKIVKTSGGYRTTHVPVKLIHITQGNTRHIPVRVNIQPQSSIQTGSNSRTNLGRNQAAVKLVHLPVLTSAPSVVNRVRATKVPVKTSAFNDQQNGANVLISSKPQQSSGVKKHVTIIAKDSVVIHTPILRTVVQPSKTVPDVPQSSTVLISTAAKTSPGAIHTFGLNDATRNSQSADHKPLPTFNSKEKKSQTIQVTPEQLKTLLELNKFFQGPTKEIYKIAPLERAAETKRVNISGEITTVLNNQSVTTSKSTGFSKFPQQQPRSSVKQDQKQLLRGSNPTRNKPSTQQTTKPPVVERHQYTAPTTTASPLDFPYNETVDSLFLALLVAGGDLLDLPDVITSTKMSAPGNEVVDPQLIPDYLPSSSNTSDISSPTMTEMISEAPDLPGSPTFVHRAPPDSRTAADQFESAVNGSKHPGSEPPADLPDGPTFLPQDLSKSRGSNASQPLNTEKGQSPELPGSPVFRNEGSTRRTSNSELQNAEVTEPPEPLSSENGTQTLNEEILPGQPSFVTSQQQQQVRADGVPAPVSSASNKRLASSSGPVVESADAVHETNLPRKQISATNKLTVPNLRSPASSLKQQHAVNETPAPRQHHKPAKQKNNSTSTSNTKPTTTTAVSRDNNLTLRLNENEPLTLRDFILLFT